MAGIDNSIYFQTPAQSGRTLGDALGEGMRLRDMADDRAYKLREREYQDRERAYQDEQRKLAAMDRETAEYGRIFGSVKDQAGWEAARGEWQKRGYSGLDQLPPAFDPGFNSTMLARSMSYQDQLAQKRQAQLDKERGEDRTIDNRYKRAQIGRLEAEAYKDRVAAGASLGGPGKTEGTKALDRDYAKDYNDWTSGGKASLDKNLALLEQAAQTLEQRKDDWFGTSGRFTGRLPDVMRSEESIRLRENVHQAAQASLKAALGSAFTEKEGERIMNASYNEKLSPQENLQKLRTAIAELREKSTNADSKARYFENRGSLAGYRAGTAVANAPGERKTWQGVVYEQQNGQWVPIGQERMAGR